MSDRFDSFGARRFLCSIPSASQSSNSSIPRNRGAKQRTGCTEEWVCLLNGERGVESPPIGQCNGLDKDY